MDRFDADARLQYQQTMAFIETLNPAVFTDITEYNKDPEHKYKHLFWCLRDGRAVRPSSSLSNAYNHNQSICILYEAYMGLGYHVHIIYDKPTAQYKFIGLESCSDYVSDIFATEDWDAMFEYVCKYFEDLWAN